jgi:hypothetical protein
MSCSGTFRKWTELQECRNEPTFIRSRSRLNLRDAQTSILLRLVTSSGDEL